MLAIYCVRKMHVSDLGEDCRKILDIVVAVVGH